MWTQTERSSISISRKQWHSPHFKNELLQGFRRGGETPGCVSLLLGAFVESACKCLGQCFLRGPRTHSRFLSFYGREKYRKSVRNLNCIDIPCHPLVSSMVKGKRVTRESRSASIWGRVGRELLFRWACFKGLCPPNTDLHSGSFVWVNIFAPLPMHKGACIALTDYKVTFVWSFRLYFFFNSSMSNSFSLASRTQ